VHAADAARAWRNIAAATSRRNAAASLIAGAFHTAGQSGFVGAEPFPYRDVMDPLADLDAEELLRRTAAAIEARDQPGASAAAARHAEDGHPEGPLFQLLLGYAVSADGALHAEKYYRTVCEEYGSARPEHRARHLIALARVTASQYGWEAPGLAEARERLGT
jgi:hypothetical protein